MSRLANFTITDMNDIITLVNQETYGMFGPILVSCFVILGALKLSDRYKPISAVFISMIGNLFTTIFFYLINMVSIEFIFTYILLTSVVGVLAWFR